MRLLYLISLFSFIHFVYGATLPEQVNDTSGCNGLEHCPVDANAVPSKTVVSTFGSKKAKLTNAQRLMCGLPLEAPRRATGVERRAPEPSSTPIITRSGVLQVRNSNNNEVIGYLSAITEEGIYTLDSALMNAAIIETSALPSTTQASGLRLTISGSDIGPNSPILGLVQGRDNVDTDIRVGSYNYLYFGGVALPGTAAGSLPTISDNSYTNSTLISRAVETDVWDINFATEETSATWINSMFGGATTYFFVQGDILYAGGDVPAFSNEYGAPVTPVTLRFIS
ncbi:hypothetical protein D9613_006621 [Agrocybe pediades]|uniref:Uncharacterized protein n=1 Tax=Agrocybe pediades TaxID=84607 RepID=A0A8H4QHZ3_9AGAR|nr:hypothetical protein D9613_006621 [Agrocybe pediades]